MTTMTTDITILLVDDEKNIRKVLTSVLKGAGYTVMAAESAEAAWPVLKASEVDLLITDLKLPGKSGLELLEGVKTCWPRMPVIMITAFGSIEGAVQAMQLGAYNYLAKPVNNDELLLLIKNALEQSNLQEENTALKRELKDRYSLGSMVGKSKAMQEVFNLVEKVADYKANILITGETGTGKELVARGIHYSGSSGGKPFVTIDCASIPENLLESELFGYAKGAFTGADDSKKGQIEMAHGGTLFLDEVGELPLGLQKKLLRFLQEKEFVRVGGTKRRKVDVRILAATNKDLESEVKAGTWREDLFYRLNVITIHLPPLRDRKEDISLLINFFLDKYNTQNQRSIQGVTSDVHTVFELYAWPGNVRELENVIERGVVLCTGDMITLSCLPPKLAELETEKDTENGLNLMDVEKKLIVRALDQDGGNQSAAARTLGISRKQLRTKMKHHGLL